MSIHVVVPLLEGVSAASLAVTVQAVETANQLSAAVLVRPRPFRLTLASLAGGPIRCGTALGVPETARLAGLRPELVVVPGMGAATEAQVDELLARTEVAALGEWLRRHAQRTLASSCSGVFVLAASGLLDERRVTTTWWLASALAARFPRLQVEREAMVLDDRSRVTAGASFAQLDLMLHLIARHVGPELAGLVARYLVVDERPSQGRYIVPSHLASASPEVQAAERWVRRHVAEDFSIPDLARAAGVSHRTLARRIEEATGSGPLAFVRGIRIQVARHLLGTTRLSVDEVAERVGYGDATSLRRALAELGLRPSELRPRARGA